MSGHLYLSIFPIGKNERIVNQFLEKASLSDLKFTTVLMRKSDIYKAKQVNLFGKDFTLVRVFTDPKYTEEAGMQSTATTFILIQESVPELYDKLA